LKRIKLIKLKELTSEENFFSLLNEFLLNDEYISIYSAALFEVNFTEAEEFNIATPTTFGIKNTHFNKLSMFQADFYKVTSDALRSIIHSELQEIGFTDSQPASEDCDFIKYITITPHAQILINEENGFMRGIPVTGSITDTDDPSGYKIDDIYLREDLAKEYLEKINQSKEVATLQKVSSKQNDYKDTVPSQNLKGLHEAIIYTLLKMLKTDAANGEIKAYSELSKLLTNDQSSFVQSQLSSTIIEDCKNLKIERDLFKEKTISQKISSIISSFEKN
jgi:hypothetical protein